MTIRMTNGADRFSEASGFHLEGRKWEGNPQCSQLGSAQATRAFPLFDHVGTHYSHAPRPDAHPLTCGGRRVPCC